MQALAERMVEGAPADTWQQFARWCGQLREPIASPVYAGEVDDDLMAAAAQPRCPSCGVLMRDSPDTYTCPACGHSALIPQIEHPGGGEGLLEFRPW